MFYVNVVGNILWNLQITDMENLHGIKITITEVPEVHR